MEDIKTEKIKHIHRILVWIFGGISGGVKVNV
jgi:hypothetical protein